MIFHSNQMFTEGKSDISAEKAARIGTFFIGVSGFVGTAIALYLSKFYGRKTILLLSSIAMTIILILLGVMSVLGYLIPQIIGTNIFVVIFDLSIGPTLWLYSAEVIPAKGMSVVVFVNMIFTIRNKSNIPLLLLLLDLSQIFL